MINIVFKHPKWWVIDKKEGLSAHNQNGNDVISILQNQYSLENAHIVNRLDQETSGLMTIALTSQAATEMQQSLKEGKKNYLAILRGKIKNSEGVWSWDLSDKAEGRNNPQGLKSERVSAVSNWKLLNQNNYFSLVEVRIETGRQHQIRKHCALAKHPVLGDKRYNEPKYNSKIQSIYKFDRMALHAFQLSFKYEGKVYEFESPEPEEFQKLFKVDTPG